MKVSELEVGMIITPSVNKYTKMKAKLRIKDRSVHYPGGKKKTVRGAEVCARAFHAHENYYDYAIYMGFERGSAWLDGVKKHHLLLVGSTLSYISGYEFRYMEAAVNES